MSGQPPALDQYMEAPSGRSPRAFRNQQPTLRQPARQFDGYGPINPPGSLYNPNDPMARYDARRADNRFGPVIPNTQMNGGPFAYDGNAAAQTWNAAAANAFAGSHQILPPQVAGTMAPIGSQPARLRSSRPRAGLPGVSISDATLLTNELTENIAMARPAADATAFPHHGAVPFWITGHAAELSR